MLPVMSPPSRRAVLAAASLAACGASPALRLPESPRQARVGETAPGFADAAAEAGALLAQHAASIGAPALSAAIAVGGAVVWSAAFGFADAAAGVAATPQTRFRIGSTSKAVSVTLTARLVEQGVVAWDEPIASYKRDLPEHWRPLTLRQLHSHTAGIPGYENNRDLAGLWRTMRKQRHYETIAASLDDFDGAPLLYEPGAGFHYSTFDVTLASAVVEAAAGEPFMALLAREVLLPAGMTSTDADSETASGRARFYDRAGRSLVRQSGFVDLSGRLAGGGLISTSSDLARLGAAYLSASLLRPETIATLWTPQRLADGEVNEQHYALGWRSRRAVSEPFGREIWRAHHGGVSTGAMSWLCCYPEEGVAVALNINTRARTFADFNAPSDALARLFAAARPA